MIAFEISNAFGEEALEKYNTFFGSPSQRTSMPDSDILLVIFASRALRLLDSVKIVTSWISENRHHVTDEISGAIVVASGKTHENEMSIAFRYAKMNETERAFSLISAVESFDSEMLDGIFATSNDLMQGKLLNFMISLLEFRFNFDPFIKVSGEESKNFFRCVEFVEEKLKHYKFSLDSIKKIKAYALINLRDFTAAAEALDAVKGIDANKLRLEVELKKSVLDGHLETAEDIAFKLINVFLNTLSAPKKPKEALKFDTSQCLVALRQTYNILDSNDLDPFLISGTLLGFVREGRIFDHDKDFDIAVIGWEKQFSVFQALYNSKAYALDIRKLRGNKTFTFSALHRKTGIAFDIFFLHPQKDKLLHGVDVDMGFTHHFTFSAIDLEVMQFGEDFFRVPVQRERFLSENYGEGWKVPDSGYEVLLEAPAILDKSGPHYRLMSLLRIINGLSKGDTRAVKRIILFLRNLEFIDGDDFANYLRDFPLNRLRY